MLSSARLILVVLKLARLLICIRSLGGGGECEEGV